MAGRFVLVSLVVAAALARWKVTLQAGTYKFRCDAHPKTMRGSFTVS